MESRLLEPKGELTPQSVHDLIAALDDERGGRRVVVTLRSITGVRWSALCELATAFRIRRARYDLRLRDVTPRLSPLFQEVGLHGGYRA